MNTATIDFSHAWYEDAVALILGSAITAFGVLLLKAAGLVVGGVAGLALTLSYLTHLDVGVLFFALNAPFFAFGQRALGWTFTLKSLAVSGLLASCTLLFPRWINLSTIDPLFASLLGGALCGLGVLSLVRHRASVGGMGVVVAWLNKRHKIPMGASQLLTDALVIAASLVAIDLRHLSYSIVGATTLSLVVFLNHRPGRYRG